jgi:DNA-binding transcriptional LysR family regulator
MAQLTYPAYGAEPAALPEVAGAPQAIELRHLRYFVAVAEAGSFTHAAERMFIAQPTLSQQIRRLEEFVGAQLLHRRREGLQLTKAGSVLLEASRTVLSLVDHEVNRTRQAAGLGRPRLRVVVPPGLPDALAVQAASALRSTAAAEDVEIAWMESPLDAGFALIAQRRADAGLGWLTDGIEALPAPLEVMSLGEFEPDVWVPAAHPAARSGTISLGDLARMDVVHGPRSLDPGVYDAWTRVLRMVDPQFEFASPPRAAFAADGSGLRRDREPAHRRADRPRRRCRRPARADPAATGHGQPRHGPGRSRTSPADGHRGRSVERRSAPPASAGSLRRRRQDHSAGPGPDRRARARSHQPLRLSSPKRRGDSAQNGGKCPRSWPPPGGPHQQPRQPRGNRPGRPGRSPGAEIPPIGGTATHADATFPQIKPTS